MVATNPAGQSEPEQVERDQALARHSEAERALRDCIKDGGFVVALSGGGHRASLAALGSLMAIVDRGLAKKLIQVASVSGGSITNAFVAQRCRLEDLGPCELDETAAELATTIIRRGVLTDRWIALLILAPLAAAITSGLLLRQLIDLPSWLAVSSAAVFAVVLALTALIARGLAIEWLLDRRYFRHSSSAENRNAWGRAQFTSLSGGRIDHVFCMTDLVLGLPVYASSQHGGMIWRRLKAEPYPEPYRSHRVEMQTFNASHLSIAEVVRASAAFPGIPPRRLRIPRDPQMEAPLDELPQVAFLGATDKERDWLAYILDGPEPQGSYPACGLASSDDWVALWGSATWRQLVDKEGSDRVDAPTTLGRLELGLARRLIMRGYLNTFVASLFLAPLADGEINRLAALSDRIDKIVGRRNRSLGLGCLQTDAPSVC